MCTTLTGPESGHSRSRLQIAVVRRGTVLGSRPLRGVLRAALLAGIAARKRYRSAARLDLRLGFEVVPAATLANEARPLVKHANFARSCHIGGTELDNARQVVRRAADDVQDLQAAPPWVVA